METFVVRVWKPDGAEPSLGFRGTALHLSSGTSLTFTEAQTLIRFLVDAEASGGAETVVSDVLGHDRAVQ
jgi:hypothetical protein